MAINTANTILSSSIDGTTYDKLVDIVAYPDLGSTPSKLDTTTLTAKKYKTSILGLQEVPDLTFEAMYTKADYTKVVALEGQDLKFKLEFGEGGVDGTLTWDGQVSTFINGGQPDEVRKMTLTCSAETEITVA